MSEIAVDIYCPEHGKIPHPFDSPSVRVLTTPETVYTPHAFEEVAHQVRKQLEYHAKREHGAGGEPVGKEEDNG